MRNGEIGSVVEAVKSWNPHSVTSRQITYLDLSSVDNKSKLIVAPTIVASSEAPSRARQLVSTGDVLVSTVRPNLNAVASVPPELDGATASTGFCVLRPREGQVDGRYLFHWVRTRTFISEMERLATGASYPAVSDKIIHGANIPLPSVEEQQRIASILDAADELRTKRRQALTKHDTLTQAIFIDMFGDPFISDAKTQPLSAMAEILMGQSPSGSSYNDDARGTPLLNGPSEFGATHPTAVQWTTAPTQLSREGDVLFCVRGATAGRMNWSDDEYCLGRGLAAIRVEHAWRPFIYSVLSAYYPRFQTLGVGSTFINISKKDLHRLPIPVAKSETIARYGDVHQRIQALKETAKLELGRLDALFASLQHRAFRG